MASSKDKLPLIVKKQSAHGGKEKKGARMTNTAACDSTRAEEGRRCYSWLEDYLQRLEGKEAYREFQERYYGTPEYYALVPSLAA
jgi:hypothetical protein